MSTTSALHVYASTTNIFWEWQLHSSRNMLVVPSVKREGCCQDRGGHLVPGTTYSVQVPGTLLLILRRTTNYRLTVSRGGGTKTGEWVSVLSLFIQEKKSIAQSRTRAIESSAKDGTTDWTLIHGLTKTTMYCKIV